jgi:hypothetical protein
MTIHYYGALKITTVILSVAAAAIIALDPTIKVALIVATPGTITGILTFTLGILGRRDARELKMGQENMQSSVDGKLSQLIETKEQLSHAQGRREGVEAAEVKGNEETSHKDKETH